MHLLRQLCLRINMIFFTDRCEKYLFTREARILLRYYRGIKIFADNPIKWSFHLLNFLIDSYVNSSFQISEIRTVIVETKNKDEDGRSFNNNETNVIGVREVGIINARIISTGL